MVQMEKVSNPTPAPPLQGRGVATALTAARDSVGAPLPYRGGAGVESLTKSYPVFYGYQLSESLLVKMVKET